MQQVSTTGVWLTSPQHLEEGPEGLEFKCEWYSVHVGIKLEKILHYFLQHSLVQPMLERDLRHPILTVVGFALDFPAKYA
jgi:hypothetical protein